MGRKKDRVAILLEIVLEFSSGKHAARISDLSMGGCFVDSIAPVHVGDTISFTLGATDEYGEDMSGEVAYVLPGSGFGLSFKDLSEWQQMRIAEMILANGGTL